MFSSGPNYTKLKTHLRLAVNRLKLLEKKKTELAQKARKEIADYLATGKYERAKIRVEHIIREDYLVEAMEIVEMFCDLLLARFGLLTQMKELDSGIAEQVSSLIWVAPRLQSDVEELRVISELLTSKYGKPFAELARTATGDHMVSVKLMNKLAIQAPPKLLVEKYLIEIANIYHIDYEPDSQVMKGDNIDDGVLIDFTDRNNLGGGGSGGNTVPQPLGFIGYPQPPALPNMPLPPTNIPFNYPNIGGGGGGGGATAPPFNYNIPPNQEKKDLNINTNFLNEESNIHPPAYSSVSPDDNIQNLNKPKPQPRSKMTNEDNIFPDLPNVPLDLPDIPGGDNNKSNPDNDEIDFDDLSRRFEELKKKR
ncbi:IST1 like [Pseudolycoriella hygida]|uniref:IST1 homolog n=1 Tax=Pseudolycoriella hygida TaxID=35572 RepID=A0A9Q0N0N2_9DIPT|nr:IST1 like [Pseudolycoriella hygida]